jgi:uncharacterized protein YndB with AHSA1/START domain
MAIAVTVESTIARPPDEVFAAIADLDEWPSWLVASGIVSLRRDHAGGARAGERLIVQQDAAGRAGTFETEVLAAEPASRLVLHGRDAEGVSIDIEGVVAAIDTDGASTLLRWSIRIGLPLRYRMFESVARPLVQRAAALDVESLRRTLEARPRD